MYIAQSDKNISARNSTETVEAMIALKLYEDLITELRCPSCACPMEAPIKLCETGHSVCNLCTKMLAKCPLCLNSFTEIRSLTLEAVSTKAQFRCANSFLGCPVRLQVSLLGKHEKHCAYQLGDCFMGKVWGNCKWHGREIDWIDHCELDHREKVFFGAEVTRTWEMKRTPPKPICGYFVFRVFSETFNFYQVYDNHRNKLCWTMVVASKDPSVAKRYSFEVELFSPSDETKLSVQRNPCHGDRNAGILRDGKCAIFDLGEIMRFMDENRILHYRIKIMVNSQSLKRSSLIKTSPANRINRFLEMDFGQTNIEGGNIKKIPSEKIITRISTNGRIGNHYGQPENSSTSIDATFSNTKENLMSTVKSIPIASLKGLVINKAIKFGSSSSTTEPRSPLEIPYKKGMHWEQISKTDSIDQTIIENNDLKKIFVCSYDVDVTNIEDLLDESKTTLNWVNSIPKPPRISVDFKKEKTVEIHRLLHSNVST